MTMTLYIVFVLALLLIVGMAGFAYFAQRQHARIARAEELLDRFCTLVEGYQLKIAVVLDIATDYQSSLDATARSLLLDAQRIVNNQNIVLDERCRQLQSNPSKVTKSFLQASEQCIGLSLFAEDHWTSRIDRSLKAVCQQVLAASVRASEAKIPKNRARKPTSELLRSVGMPSDIKE